VGWRNLFSSCAVVSFFCFLVVAKIVLGDTYLPYQLWCCVFFFAAGNSFWLHRSVFWLWWEIVLGVTSLLMVSTILTDSHIMFWWIVLEAAQIWRELEMYLEYHTVVVLC
jgi:hypothetical protein